MKQQQGFTLIELIVVIVILGILAATAVPKFIDLRADASKAAVAAVAGAFSSAFAMNQAGCSLTGNVAGIQCVQVHSATDTCSSVTGVMAAGGAPVITGVKPATTVAGLYYVAALTPLTTTGVTCTLVLGDGSAAGYTANYTAYATGI